MKNMFLTGPMGSGKTALLKKVMECVCCSIGGYMVHKLRNHNENIFEMVSLNDGMGNSILAVYDRMTGKINIKEPVFENEGWAVLGYALSNRDVIVMDELGFMEDNCKGFKEKVIEALDSPKVVLGVLKEHDSRFLNSIRNREDTVIMEVSIENRDNLFNDMLEILKRWNIPVKSLHPFYSNKKSIAQYNEALDAPYNTYPGDIISIMEKRTGFKNKKIVDVGSGTGAISLPLALKGADVTAVDSSFNMLYSMRERAISRNVKNIKYLLSPWEDIAIERHHIGVSAYCCGTIVNKSSLEKLYACVEESIFVVLPQKKYDRNFNINELFKKLGRPPLKYHDVSKDMISLIDKLGYRYNVIEMECKLDQYFASINDGVEFFKNHHDINDAYETKITEEFVRGNIEKYNEEYIFPNTRRCSLITIFKN